MNYSPRLHELECLSDLPDGIRQIVEVFDRVHRQVGEEHPAAASVQEMIYYIVDHEQLSCSSHSAQLGTGAYATLALAAQ